MKALLENFVESDLIECIAVGATFTNRPAIQHFCTQLLNITTKNTVVKHVSWTSLLPHQIEGVQWMKMREEDASNAGGILADEMGLGKTVTMLANIHYHAPATNLIVCPAAVVGHWLHEIGRWVGTNNAFHYTGTVIFNKQFCVVSYTMMQKDYPAGWLFQQRWKRVVLDEAHTIRNCGKTYVACMHLRSQCRWALSGTPVQNSPKDFDALIAFVCSNEGRERVVASSGSKLKKRYRTNESKRNTLEPQAMFLRREIATTVALPTKRTQCILIPWCSDYERDQYIRLFKEVSEYVSRKGFQTEVLTYLNNLRFFCSTGIMPHSDVTTAEEEDGEVDLQFTRDGRGMNPKDVPRMRKEGTVVDEHFFNLYQIPGKLREVVRLVSSIPTNEKIVIFSQWLHVLSVLEDCLDNTVRYDGRMSYEAKNVALETFANDDRMRILLISLKAGNAGINLSCASRVIMVDPWWNPGVEKQAEDRVYRIGQVRPVFVYYLIMHNSIEQQIFDMKEQKNRHCADFFDDMETVYRAVLAPPTVPRDSNSIRTLSSANIIAPEAQFISDRMWDSLRGLGRAKGVKNAERATESEEQKQMSDHIEEEESDTGLLAPSSAEIG